MSLTSKKAVLGAAILVASLAANVGLARACLEFYRREQRVRLHPTHPVPAPVVSPAEKSLVLLLGDSRIQEWPALRDPRFVTVNAGGGGETTAQIRLRAAATLDAVAPRLVVLQAGINDLKAIGALPDAANEIEQQCLSNLSALVELCRQRGAQVVVLPILAAAQPSLARLPVWSSEIEAARGRVNAELRKRFGATPGVALLGDDLLHPDTSTDYRDTLHLRPQAYTKLESAALKAIEGLIASR
jgi:lysophospholipase L1-like esterase